MFIHTHIFKLLGKKYKDWKSVEKAEYISGEMVFVKYFYLSFLRSILRKLEFTLS